MVFRFRSPIKTNFQEEIANIKPSRDKLLSQCIRAQMKSVYASDYSNNVDLKIENQKDKHMVISVNSKPKQSSSFNYNYPFSYESLNPSPIRFGSNKKHIRAAEGILPNIKNNL